MRPSHRTVLVLFIALAVAGPLSAPASETLPEVQNLRFTSKTDFKWDPVAGVDGYNVYRGVRSALPGDYGNCFQPDVLAVMRISLWRRALRGLRSGFANPNTLGTRRQGKFRMCWTG